VVCVVVVVVVGLAISAGTTRDSVRISWEYEGRKVVLVDTAGIKRLGRWDPSSLIDSVATSNASKSMSKAHVIALVVDAKEPLTKQDLALAQKAVDDGRCIVVVLNKMDAVDDKKLLADGVSQRLGSAMWQAQGVECVPVSALNNDGVEDIMPAVLRAYTSWSTRVPSRVLNKWFELVQRHHPPPTVMKTMFRKMPGGGGKPFPVQVPLKLKFISQIYSQPPTFAIFANRKEMPDSYTRFLINSLREEFGFNGCPIRIVVRGAKNPFKQRV